MTPVPVPSLATATVPELTASVRPLISETPLKSAVGSANVGVAGVNGKLKDPVPTLVSGTTSTTTTGGRAPTVRLSEALVMVPAPACAEMPNANTAETNRTDNLRISFPLLSWISLV
jgi:hypothetical protein